MPWVAIGSLVVYYYDSRYSEGLDTRGVSDLASARGHEGTWTNQDSRIIYIIEKLVRQHNLSMRR